MEKGAQHIATQQFYLSVAGWRYPRRAFIEENILVMEVAMGACQHCPTCSKRVDTLTARLRETDAKWEWKHFDGGLWLAIELPNEPRQVEQNLSRLIGIPARLN